MKKVILVLLSVLMLLCVVACKDDINLTTKESQIFINTTTETSISVIKSLAKAKIASAEANAIAKQPEIKNKILALGNIGNYYIDKESIGKEAEAIGTAYIGEVGSDGTMSGILGSCACQPEVFASFAKIALDLCGSLVSPTDTWAVVSTKTDLPTTISDIDAKLLDYLVICFGNVASGKDRNIYSYVDNKTTYTNYTSFTSSKEILYLVSKTN